MPYLPTELASWTDRQKTAAGGAALSRARAAAPAASVLPPTVESREPKISGARASAADFEPGNIVAFVVVVVVFVRLFELGSVDAPRVTSSAVARSSSYSSSSSSSPASSSALTSVQLCVSDGQEVVVCLQHGKSERIDNEQVNFEIREASSNKAVSKQ